MSGKQFYLVLWAVILYAVTIAGGCGTRFAYVYPDGSYAEYDRKGDTAFDGGEYGLEMTVTEQLDPITGAVLTRTTKTVRTIAMQGYRSETSAMAGQIAEGVTRGIGAAASGALPIP